MSINLKKYVDVLNLNKQITESINALKTDTSNISLNERRKFCENLIDNFSRLNGAVSIYPFPFSDIMILTPAQISMVIKIARVYERQIDLKITKEIISTIIKGIIARAITKNIIRFIPIFGNIICFFSGYLVTQLIGSSALKIFEANEEFNLDNFKKVIKKENERINPVRMILQSGFHINEAIPENFIQSVKNIDIEELKREIKSLVLYIPNEN